MSESDKRVVSISSRLAKYIGSKATREKRLQAASMQAEFALRDTLIILCYLSKDSDPEITEQARKNLIPAARNWYSRPDRPDLPEPIHEIVMKVIEKVGLGEKEVKVEEVQSEVMGNIGLLGLGEIIQSVDHNSRTVWVVLDKDGETATVFTQNGKVVGAICGDQDGLDALYKCFGWVDATFKYLHAPPGDFNNRIKSNTLTLVMDALDYAPDEDPYALDISMGWRVRGQLKIMNLFEIAEIFEMNSKQAICKLMREGTEGRLFFNNGRVVNAQLGDMGGMDAACHLLAWPSATFEILRGGEDMPEVIHVGMQNLIIEAMRLLDEGITVTERIATELALINELFDGADVHSLPVLDKVRLIFGEDQRAREALEADANPLVRKAIKVKISKTVHKYISAAADAEMKLRAAKGEIALPTTEKLVLLTYLSHDEAPEVKEAAKNTLESLDTPTYRKGFGTDLHPAVLDFLVRETIRDETLIQMAAGCETIMETTALHILDNWPNPTLRVTTLGNKKLIEQSPAVVARLWEDCKDDETLGPKIQRFEESMLQGQTELKVEGPLTIYGLGGLIRSARQGGRSGTIVVIGSVETGRVFFKRGKVIGATWGSLEGAPAMEEILKAKTPRFRYLLRTHFHVENIDSSVGEDYVNSPAAAAGAQTELANAVPPISGSLQVLDMFEALSALEGTPYPASVSIVCEEGAGEIIRDRSRVLHAQVKGIDDPVKAMAAMLSWTPLRFVTRYTLTDFPITVDKNLYDFFTEAMKEIPDEFGRAAKPGDMPEWELSEDEFESLYNRVLQMGVAEKIKLALTGNKEARDILIRDSNKMVAIAVIKSPKIQENEIESISKSRQVSEDVLRQIATNKEWMQSYTIKLNLVSNSKTPLPVSMKLINHVRENDLRKLGKDKNVPQAIATHARRLLETKGKG